MKTPPHSDGMPMTTKIAIVAVTCLLTLFLVPGASTALAEGDDLDQAIIDRLVQTLSERDTVPDGLKHESDYINAHVTDAVVSLREQTDIKDASIRIEDARAAMAKGDTRPAEAIYAAVLANHENEDPASKFKAALAARRLGALSFLHDTNKALTAYRLATELDPTNMNGWGQLAYVLSQSGELSEAIEAYRELARLAESDGNRQALSIAYSQLGDIHRTRGELDLAEESHRKALTIFKAMGRTSSIFVTYRSLGGIYRDRGELDLAEANTAKRWPSRKLPTTRRELWQFSKNWT